MLIGISGKAGSGKTNLARYLAEEFDFTVLSFASSLKEQVESLFGVKITQQWKNEKTDFFWNGERLTGRKLLQVYGTDIMRTIHPTIWVDALAKKMDRGRSYVIDDVRMKNELDWIKEEGGYTIRLTRNPFGMEHESEVQLDCEEFDKVFVNSLMPEKKVFTLAAQFVSGLILHHYVLKHLPFDREILKYPSTQS